VSGCTVSGGRLAQTARGADNIVRIARFHKDSVCASGVCACGVRRIRLACHDENATRLRVWVVAQHRAQPVPVDTSEARLCNHELGVFTHGLAERFGSVLGFADDVRKPAEQSPEQQSRVGVTVDKQNGVDQTR
jgi:hypothetical protein